MVEANHGIGSHHLAEVETLPDLHLKGRECANTMNMGIAKKDLHVIICILESFMNFEQHRLVNLCTVILFDRSLL